MWSPYIFEDVMATNDTFMQEYWIFQVSYARHSADVQLIALTCILARSQTRTPP